MRIIPFYLFTLADLFFFCGLKWDLHGIHVENDENEHVLVQQHNRTVQAGHRLRAMMHTRIGKTHSSHRWKVCLLNEKCAWFLNFLNNFSTCVNLVFCTCLTPPLAERGSCTNVHLLHTCEHPARSTWEANKSRERGAQNAHKNGCKHGLKISQRMSGPAISLTKTISMPWSLHVIWEKATSRLKKSRLVEM